MRNYGKRLGNIQKGYVHGKNSKNITLSRFCSDLKKRRGENIRPYRLRRERDSRLLSHLYFAFVCIYFILLQIIENLQFISFHCADEVVRS